MIALLNEASIDADAFDVVELTDSLVRALVECTLLVVALDDNTLGVAVLFVTSLCEASLDVAAIEI